MSARITPGAVVVGVDGSRHERWAVDWGVCKAVAQRRPLVLLRASDPRPTGSTPEEETLTRRERRDRDTGRVRALHPGLDVETVADHGDPRAVLLRASLRASHLVVGSRGRGPLASLLLGSVSAAVAAHATCPVTVVRPHHPGTVRHGVLVGADDTPESHEVLEHAFREASERRLPLTVRHCRWDVVATTDRPPHVLDAGPAAQDGGLLLAEAVAGFRERYPDVPVATELARGLPAHALVAGSERMDLLVVGRHPHSRLERALQSAVASAVVERAGCPVLVVPLDTSIGVASSVG